MKKQHSNSFFYLLASSNYFNFSSAFFVDIFSYRCTSAKISLVFFKSFVNSLFLNRNKLNSYFIF